MQKTLLVEDSKTFRQTFKAALCRRFTTMLVEEAADGTQAIEKISSFQPDLVFMDIRLPGKSGIEITEMIKACHPEIRVIILTEYDLPEYRTAAQESGADDFIPKGSLNLSDIEEMIMRIKP
ncbi:MAG: hypothetical protein BWK80_08490 [Desulfobacteraceae bacterium IS3]|nr:MAG: hypothetical protein BWK80_08490 [Desulfobacteraceae bacterium IS3]